MSRTNFSRREFLKLTGLSFAGLFLPNSFQRHNQDDIFDNLQGRVLDRTLWSYDAPSFKGKRQKIYWRDLVLNIANTTISDDQKAYNRIWYETEDGGYVYSGSVQPVRTILNQPRPITLQGALGEISVPFTDAYLSLDANAPVVYRLYYETVHWVTASALHPVDGSMWYVLMDDKFASSYYVRGEHVRLLTPEELTPVSPNISNADKRIEVRLTDQLVLALEKETVVFATRASTGARLSSGTYTTPDGTFKTFHKRPTRHMARGDIAASGFDLPGVPWVIYIKENGISFHGTYWHNDYGHPHSHGCINLTPQAAKWLFRWTIPTVPFDKEFVYGEVGTRVDVIV